MAEGNLKLGSELMMYGGVVELPRRLRESTKFQPQSGGPPQLGGTWAIPDDNDPNNPPTAISNGALRPTELINVNHREGVLIRVYRGRSHRSRREIKQKGAITGS